jgi:cobalt-zinc-cadmium efflux system protein
MLVIVAVGMVVNLVSMRVLASGKDNSLNMKGAYLEVWSDLLGSAGMIVRAVVIKLTGWAWVDSAVAVLIGLSVLPRTWVLLKPSLSILLEGVADEIDVWASQAPGRTIPRHERRGARTHIPEALCGRKLHPTPSHSTTRRNPTLLRWRLP